MGRAKKPFKYYFRQIGDKNIWYYSISPASGVPVELCEDRKSSQIEVELDGNSFVRILRQSVHTLLVFFQMAIAILTLSVKTNDHE